MCSISAAEPRLHPCSGCHIPALSRRGWPCPLRPAPSHLAGHGARLVTWSDCKCAAVARQNRAEPLCPQLFTRADKCLSLPPAFRENTQQSHLSKCQMSVTHTLTGETSLRSQSRLDMNKPSILGFFGNYIEYTIQNILYL